jgi:cyanate permease
MRRTISCMSGMLGAVTPRLRLSLAVMVGAVAALLMPLLLTTSVDAPTVVLAALVVALAATGGFNSQVGTLVARALAPLPHTADDAPMFLAGRVTDPVHHPIRPRAPGMA